MKVRKKQMRELTGEEQEELMGWISTLTEKEDHEDAFYFKEWLLKHSKDPEEYVFVFFASVPPQTPPPLAHSTPHILAYTTHVLAETTTQNLKEEEEEKERLVGVASLVKDDYGRKPPEGGWILGGVNVRREWRGRGIGRAMVSDVVEEVQRMAVESLRVIPVLLYAVDAALVESLYQKLGWQPTIPRKEDWPLEDIPCLQYFNPQ